MKTLQNSTRNWKTTFIGVLIILGWFCKSLLNYLQTGQLPSLEEAVAAWTVGTGFILAKDGDKSGVTKMLLLLPCVLLLAACSTNAAGEKTFLLLTSKDWGEVAKGTGADLGKALPATALKNYQAVKNRPSGKAVVEVQPIEEAAPPASGGWFSWLGL